MPTLRITENLDLNTTRLLTSLHRLNFFHFPFISMISAHTCWTCGGGRLSTVFCFEHDRVVDESISIWISRVWKKHEYIFFLLSGLSTSFNHAPYSVSLFKTFLFSPKHFDKYVYINMCLFKFMKSHLRSYNSCTWGVVFIQICGRFYCFRFILQIVQPTWFYFCIK